MPLSLIIPKKKLYILHNQQFELKHLTNSLKHIGNSNSCLVIELMLRKDQLTLHNDIAPTLQQLIQHDSWV